MMRKPYFLALLVVAAALVGVVLSKQEKQPGSDAKRWFKGNTHTHSLWSDGNDFPEMIVDWYRKKGYDFLALSDHNVLSRSEKWMPVTEVEKRRKDGKTGTMEKYLAAFGEGWVEQRENNGKKEVRLKKLAEIRPRFEAERDFLLIEAEEISAHFGSRPIHINAINLDEVIPPQGGDSVVEVMRNNLRVVREQSERLKRPILTHVNHPNFHWAISARDLAEIVEERYFEVYNGHPGINHLGDAERPGDEAIWDIANTLRLMASDAPPLFAVATDDSHTYHGGNNSPGRGWVMVRAEKLAADSLIAAMERGDFYASTGVVLEDVKYDPRNRKYHIRIQVPDGVTHETRFIGTRTSTPEKPGEVLATASGPEASYQLRGDELYVRAVVTSSRAHPNPSFKGQQEQAWTQPVGWKKMGATP
jgi:hypothetical protein